MAEIAKEQGILQYRESVVLKNMLRLRTIRTKSVMTPRTVVFALEEDRTVGEVVSEFEDLEFSRIPIYCADAGSDYRLRLEGTKY